MRISIVRPPVLMPVFNMADLVVPPLGPAYIAAALRDAGHEVTLIDAVGLGIEKYTKQERGVLHGLTLDEVVDRVPPSDCIGVSIQFSYEWPVGRELLKKIRARFPKTFLMAGGEHVTAVPDLCLREAPLDAVVLGEGEETVCEMVGTLERHGTQALRGVAGLCLRDGEGMLRTGGRARIRDIDTISRPGWDMVPMEEYLSRGYGFGVNRGRSMPVLASRGCPYQCTFCSNPFMWTTRWIARDVDALLDEMAALQKAYRVTNFDFYDLTVIVKRQWILDFCRKIEERGMRFTWQLPSGTRSEAIDAEVSALLYKTGCRNISYAPESSSEETLDLIKKRVSIPMMFRSMRGAVRNKLNVKANFIMGFPHEGWRHILADFLGLIKMAVIGIHDISIWVFVPYPGSELFDQLRSNGRIGALDDEYFYRLASYADITQTHSYCRRLGKKPLLVCRTAGIFLFYGLSWTLRPWRPVRMLMNIARGRLESRSEQALRGAVKRFVKGSACTKSI